MSVLVPPTCITKARYLGKTSRHLLTNCRVGGEDSFDKSEFVAEWCSDAIRQFLSGKSITQIQNNNSNAVTDRSVSLDMILLNI